VILVAGGGAVGALPLRLRAQLAGDVEVLRLEADRRRVQVRMPLEQLGEDDGAERVPAGERPRRRRVDVDVSLARRLDPEQGGARRQVARWAGALVLVLGQDQLDALDPRLPGGAASKRLRSSSDSVPSR